MGKIDLETVVESTMNEIITKSRSQDWYFKLEGDSIASLVHPYVFGGFSKVDFSESTDLDYLYLLNRAKATIAKNMAAFLDEPVVGFDEKKFKNHILKLRNIRDYIIEEDISVIYNGDIINIFEEINKDGVSRFNPKLMKLYRENENSIYTLKEGISNEKLKKLGFNNNENDNKRNTRHAIDFYYNGLNVLDSFQNSPARKEAKKNFERKKDLITKYIDNPNMEINPDFITDVLDFSMLDSKHEGYLTRPFFNLKLTEQGDYMLMMFDAIGLNIMNRISMEDTMLKLSNEYRKKKDEGPDKKNINALLVNLLRDVDEHIENYNQMIRQRLNEKFGEDGKDGEDSYIATVGGDETIIAVPFKNIKQDYLSAIETIAGFIEEVKEEVKKSEYNFFGQELKLRSSFTDFVSTSKKEGSITEDTRFLGEIFETLVKVDIALSHAKEREKKGDNSTLYVFGHESRLIGKPREIYEKTKGKFEIHDYTNKDWEKIQEDNSLVSMHSWITPSSNVWKQLNEGRFLIHDEELTM